MFFHAWFGKQDLEFGVGGVNHYRSHCRLAKLRGLMYREKYFALIGRKARFCVCAQYEFFRPCGLFWTNYSAVFSPVHQTTEFRQTTV
jgi:hypothetical protein